MEGSWFVEAPMVGGMYGGVVSDVCLLPQVVAQGHDWDFLNFVDLPCLDPAQAPDTANPYFFPPAADVEIGQPSTPTSGVTSSEESSSEETPDNILDGWDSFVTEFRAKAAKNAKPKKEKTRVAVLGPNLQAPLHLMVDNLRLDPASSNTAKQTCDLLLGEVRSRSYLVGRTVRTFLPAILMYAIHRLHVQRTISDVYFAATRVFPDKPPTEAQINRWFRFLVKGLPQDLPIIL